MRGSAGETAGWLKGERDEGRGGGKRRKSNKTSTNRLKHHKCLL